MNNQVWLRLLEYIHEAKKKGEVPIAAALVLNNEIVSIRHNEVETSLNPLNHAEILVLQDGFLKFGKILSQCDLYVTLEPCSMCAHSIALSKIRTLYFGAYNLEGGAVEHGAKLLAHSATCFYGGYNERVFSEELSQFFKNKR